MFSNLQNMLQSVHSVTWFIKWCMSRFFMVWSTSLPLTVHLAQWEEVISRTSCIIEQTSIQQFLSEPVSKPKCAQPGPLPFDFKLVALVAIVTFSSLEETYDSLHWNSWDLQTAICIIIYSFEYIFALFIYIALPKNILTSRQRALCVVSYREKKPGIIICVALGCLHQTVSREISMQHTLKKLLCLELLPTKGSNWVFCKFSVYTSTGERAHLHFK